MSKHLEIKQTAVQENVSAAVVDKLYNLTYEDSTLGIDPEVDSQRGDIVGNIHPDAAYEDAVEFLRDKFGPDVANNIDGLTIDISTDDCYIRFKDNNVLNVLLNAGIGSNGGITKRVAAQQTSLPTFANNADITSFDELKYFTNVKNCPSFYNCTNLESIDLTNITEIRTDCFRRSGIKKVNAPNLINLSRNAFQDCYSLEEVVSLGSITVPELYRYGSNIFRSCNVLKKVTFPDTLTVIPASMFIESRVLEQVNFPSSITAVYSGAFESTPALKVIANFINVTAIEMGVFCGNGASNASGIRHVYLPKLTTTPIGADSNSAQTSLGFMWGTSWRRSSVFNIIYFRDIQSFGACTFSGGTIRNLIINNTTPPTIVSNGGTATLYTNNVSMATRTADLTNCPTQNTDIFYSVSSILNIYVPDSAYTAYTGMTWDSTNKVGVGTANAAAGYENVVNVIKPLSEMNRVATEALWQELTDTEKLDTLIEEYM